jgi:hypothetical protein
VLDEVTQQAKKFVQDGTILGDRFTRDGFLMSDDFMNCFRSYRDEMKKAVGGEDPVGKVRAFAVISTEHLTTLQVVARRELAPRRGWFK